MIQFSQSARRAVLLLNAFATVAAGWEAPALAGSHMLTTYTEGALDDDDQFMVTFYVWDTSPPMPHWVLDTTIDPLYLTYTNSELIYPPSYYKNYYSGTRSWFVTGKLYNAKLYYCNDALGSWNYLPQWDTYWTEP